MLYIKCISVKIDQLLDWSTSEGRKRKEIKCHTKVEVEQYISLDKILKTFTSGYKIC